MPFKSVLESLNQICPERVYLVGGSVRDILLGKEPRDMDLVVTGSAGETMRRLAEVQRIKQVVLDAEHDIMRAVLSCGHLDIAGLGNKGLWNDLKRRDFTVNAMALPVEEYLKGGNLSGQVIDPLGGLGDLRLGIIRACSPHVFEDDPVRVLRALRLQSRPGFKIAGSTVQLMHDLKKPLSTAPGERVWEELRRILELPCSAGAFKFLEREVKVLEQLFPEAGSMRCTGQNYYHADNVWVHCLKTLVHFENFLIENNWPPELRENVQEYLGQPLGGERKRLPVVKLACLFHDIGKVETRGEREDGRITFYGHHKAGGPMVEKIARRLRLNGKEIKLLRLLVEWHMQPLFMYKDNPPSSKAVIRFFRNLGEDTPGCLLLSLADVTSSRTSIGRQDLAQSYAGYILGLLDHYFKDKERVLYPKPLLSGKDIACILNIKPSPAVGKLKDALIDAQLEVEVTTRSEAENFVREMYLRQKDW